MSADLDPAALTAVLLDLDADIGRAVDRALIALGRIPGAGDPRKAAVRACIVDADYQARSVIALHAVIATTPPAGA